MENIKLSPNDELIKSLLVLGISQDEINKSLNIKKSDKDPEEETKEKSEEDKLDEEKDVKKSVKKSMKKSDDIDEDKKEKSEDTEDDSTDAKIKKAEEELENLKKIKKSETFAILGAEKMFDEIEKSLSNRIGESTSNFNDKFDSLVGLVKSLTDTVVSLKEDNNTLRKSLGGSEEILKKLAEYTPGLKSISNTNFIDRFAKSMTDDGKEIMSVSKQKNEIASKLAAKMDDPNFAKSYGNEISSFECSSKVSEKLEKAIHDELGIKLVQ